MSKELIDRIRELQAKDWASPNEVEAADRIMELERELEREQMRLVACGVVAMCDTPESAEKARQMHPDYESASCSDVARRVDECIELRKGIEQQQSWIASLEAHARDADRMYKELETELAEQQKRIDELERRLKSEERLSFRHQLEESQAKEALQQKRIDELLNKLDRRNEMLTESSTRWQDMQRQLAASQAQLKVLREALELIERTRPVVVMNGSAKMDDPQDVKTNYNTVFIARKALAAPTDTTALRELLKAERERRAKVCESLPVRDDDVADECAVAIRAMEDQ